MHGDLTTYCKNNKKRLYTRGFFYICNMNHSGKLVKIDVDAVLRSRLSRYYRFIPKLVIRGLARLIHQDELNALLESNAGKRDAEFCAGILSDLGVAYNVDGLDNIQHGHQRLTFVCNHPLGALDGIAMIDFVSRHVDTGVKFVVNDLLMAVEPLRGTFVPINKHGAQNRGAVVDVEAAFAGDAPVIVFPAGLCSRMGKDGRVRDREWHKMFVNKCIEYQRMVVPVFFDGRNSNFFYKFAKLRESIGLRFNLEMLLLPRELFLNRGKQFAIRIGAPIDWQALLGGKNAVAQAAAIKRTVYEMNTNII
jgi:1-acyl-sn-glycerol-3-phosphate acyltransferase